MSRALQICATLVVASGLPHGLVAPSRLRTAAHDAVHDAVVRQDRRSVAWYLQREPKSVVMRDEDQRTPLLLAVVSRSA